jgi:hypothetical protein
MAIAPAATIPFNRPQGQSALPRGKIMAKGQKKSNKEVRKPKAEKKKTIAAQPSSKQNTVSMVTLKG